MAVRERRRSSGSRNNPAPRPPQEDDSMQEMTQAEKDAAIFTVAYVVRAVAPGSYTHPQAFVEDMYRPDRFGRTATGTIEVTAAK